MDFADRKGGFPGPLSPDLQPVRDRRRTMPDLKQQKGGKLFKAIDELKDKEQ